MSALSGTVLGLVDEVVGFWDNVSFKLNFATLLDILLVAAIFYGIWAFLRETRALRILYGIVFLVGLYFFARLLELVALEFILRSVATVVAVAIPVVFQPELRAGLEKLGRTRLVADLRRLPKAEVAEVIKTVVETATVLAKNRVGALVVLAGKVGLKEYIESGTLLEAKLSSELLLSIFAPHSPLHDGAVVIVGNKVVAASVTLPLSESKFDFHLGTRHRAAIGLTSLTDALVVVVSEETSTISLSADGVLQTELSGEDLERTLAEKLVEQRR